MTKRLVNAIANNKEPPVEFIEIAYSMSTGWDYWTVVTQPTWFLERYVIYKKAESIASKLKEAKSEFKTRQKF